MNLLPNLSFGATIIMDRDKINQTLSNDKHIDSLGQQRINNMLDKVDSFSKMTEDSVVTITPYSHKNMSTLVCKVSDNLASRVIDERMSQKLATDEKFSDKYVSNIKNAIVDMDKEQDGFEEIKEAINNTKSFVGIASIFGNFKKCDTDKIGTHFCKGIGSAYDSATQRGIDPSKRIVGILQKFDNNFSDYDNYIFVGRDKSQKTVFKIFSKDKDGEFSSHKIPLDILCQDPADRLFR